jgi:hypothetical protein
MQPSQAICVFCEDIRTEASGALILVGIFPDNIRLSPLPGQIPKIGIYLRVHISTDAAVSSIRSTLHLPDGTERPMGGFDSDFIKKEQETCRQKGAPLVGFISHAVASPFVVPIPGRIVATTTINDEKIVCGSLNIDKGD